MRKSRAKKRILMPDPKFGSVLVTRFVNNLMLDGKKSIAFKVFYDALDLISAKIEEEEALVVWEKSQKLFHDVLTLKRIIDEGYS